MFLTPLTIRSVTTRNRLVVSPMCQYSSVDGFANDWHLVHLGGRAVGGAGIVFTEAAAVSPEGRISPDDLGLWKEEHVVMLSRIAGFIEQQGAVPGIQLAHAGRKASTSSPWKGNKSLTNAEGGWQTLAPSAIAYKEGQRVPKAMDKEDINKVIQDFTEASVRALKAGFKIIEVHAAHGYLINEFLSPLSNQRSDEYGGSFENRIRILVDITEAIRSVWPDELPVYVRISATDWVEGGWTVEESVALTRVLQTKGVDLIDCSSGGNSPLQKIPVAPLYQVPFAEQIKKETGILTGAVGLITADEEAEGILMNKHADLVFMARQLLRDPYFMYHAGKETGEEFTWPVQYERAKK
jgi:2,4-dienoyl-CoA reductase-like NADH-dependent reductase (Old Yellow Enzyme family)